MKDEAGLAAHYNEIVARDAAEQSRRLSLPPDANAYKAELPADFVPPQGIQYTLNEADPLLSQAKTVYHDIQTGKLSGQEGFSKLLGLYAGAQVANAQQVQTARNAEIAKLGPAGPARVDAVTTVMKSVLGEAEGTQFASRMLTASDVTIAEKLVARLNSQGTFKGTGREPPASAGKVSDQEFSKMTAAQRLDYARRFPQPSSDPGRPH